VTPRDNEASWRLPGSYPLANLDIEYFERLARLAESMTFDSPLARKP
jgi:hypothetical protein